MGCCYMCSAAQQQKSSLQVHNLCNSKLVTVMYETDTMQGLCSMLERIAYSASQTFFSGFSADENSAANTANGAGLGVYSWPKLVGGRLELQ